MWCIPFSVPILCSVIVCSFWVCLYLLSSNVVQNVENGFSEICLLLLQIFSTTYTKNNRSQTLLLLSYYEESKFCSRNVLSKTLIFFFGYISQKVNVCIYKKKMSYKFYRSLCSKIEYEREKLQLKIFSHIIL